MWAGNLIIRVSPSIADRRKQMTLDLRPPYVWIAGLWLRLFSSYLNTHVHKAPQGGAIGGQHAFL